VVWVLFGEGRVKELLGLRELHGTGAMVITAAMVAVRVAVHMGPGGLTQSCGAGW
jgi:hypothetical protein